MDGVLLYVRHHRVRVGGGWVRPRGGPSLLWMGVFPRLKKVAGAIISNKSVGGCLQSLEKSVEFKALLTHISPILSN